MQLDPPGQTGTLNLVALQGGSTPSQSDTSAAGAPFLLPSRWEGFGHVIIEAIACGLPVIAFDCPYGPADILSGRQGGVLVEPQDISGLAQAIDHLLAAPEERQSLVAAGQASIERFSLARIATEYADLIEVVAEKRRNLEPARFAQS